MSKFFACRSSRQPSLVVLGLGVTSWLLALPFPAQVETVDRAGAQVHWVSRGQVEGHLALESSPAAALSLDSKTLAVANEDSVVILELQNSQIKQTISPRIEGVVELSIRSADFLDNQRLLLRAVGRAAGRQQATTARTPELALLWDLGKNALQGGVQALAESETAGIIRFLPSHGTLAIYSRGGLNMWDPMAGRSGRLEISALTRTPRLFNITNDGQYLLAGRLEGSADPDVVVVRLKDKQIVSALKGHTALPRAIAVSDDGAWVATAGEDQTVRLWSTADWSLKTTLTGHQGPVNWVEFSPDAKLVVSAGEDRTVRVWSVADGSLQQVLSENREPVKTVAFSPDGKYLVSSTEKKVLVWGKTLAD